MSTDFALRVSVFLGILLYIARKPFLRLSSAVQSLLTLMGRLPFDALFFLFFFFLLLLFLFLLPLTLAGKIISGQPGERGDEEEPGVVRGGGEQGWL